MAAVPGTVSFDSKPSLVAQFDELVSATNVLCVGTEGGKCTSLERAAMVVYVLLSPNSVFGKFVSNQLDLYRKTEAVEAENSRLKAENSYKEIQLQRSK